MLDKSTSVGTTGSYPVHCLDLPIPIPEDIGQFLLKHEMFARGKDFSSMWGEKNIQREGVSVLKKIWEGQERKGEVSFSRLRVWIASEKGKPCGLVAIAYTPPDELESIWVNKAPKHPSHHPKERVRAGIFAQAMCYTQGPFRRKGLARALLAGYADKALQELAVKIHAKGMLPVVMASDATYTILGQETTVPLVEGAYMCQRLRDGVWEHIQEARMYPESVPDINFLVAPEPYPKPQRARLR